MGRGSWSGGGAAGPGSSGLGSSAEADVRGGASGSFSGYAPSLGGWGDSGARRDDSNDAAWPVIGGRGGDSGSGLSAEGGGIVGGATAGGGARATSEPTLAWGSGGAGGGACAGAVAAGGVAAGGLAPATLAAAESGVSLASALRAERALGAGASVTLGPPAAGPPPAWMAAGASSGGDPPAMRPPAWATTGAPPDASGDASAQASLRAELDRLRRELDDARRSLAFRDAEASELERQQAARAERAKRAEAEAAEARREAELLRAEMLRLREGRGGDVDDGGEVGAGGSRRGRRAKAADGSGSAGGERAAGGVDVAEPIGAGRPAARDACRPSPPRGGRRSPSPPSFLPAADPCGGYASFPPAASAAAGALAAAPHAASRLVEGRDALGDLARSAGGGSALLTRGLALQWGGQAPDSNTVARVRQGVLAACIGAEGGQDAFVAALVAVLDDGVQREDVRGEALERRSPLSPSLGSGRDRSQGAPARAEQIPSRAGGAFAGSGSSRGSGDATPGASSGRPSAALSVSTAPSARLFAAPAARSVCLSAADVSAATALLDALCAASPAAALRVAADPVAMDALAARAAAEAGDATAAACARVLARAAEALDDVGRGDAEAARAAPGAASTAARRSGAAALWRCVIAPDRARRIVGASPEVGCRLVRAALVGNDAAEARLRDALRLRCLPRGVRERSAADAAQVGGARVPRTAGRGSAGAGPDAPSADLLSSVPGVRSALRALKRAVDPTRPLASRSAVAAIDALLSARRRLAPTPETDATLLADVVGTPVDANDALAPRLLRAAAAAATGVGAGDDTQAASGATGLGAAPAASPSGREGGPAAALALAVECLLLLFRLVEDPVSGALESLAPTQARAAQAIGALRAVRLACLEARELQAGGAETLSRRAADGAAPGKSCIPPWGARLLCDASCGSGGAALEPWAAAPEAWPVEIRDALPAGGWLDEDGWGPSDRAGNPDEEAEVSATDGEDGLGGDLFRGSGDAWALKRSTDERWGGTGAGLFPGGAPARARVASPVSPLTAPSLYAFACSSTSPLAPGLPAAHPALAILSAQPRPLVAATPRLLDALAASILVRLLWALDAADEAEARTLLSS